MLTEIIGRLAQRMRFLNETVMEAMLEMTLRNADTNNTQARLRREQALHQTSLGIYRKWLQGQFQDDHRL